jgi:hypothetical protein
VSADEHRPVFMSESVEFAPLGQYERDLWMTYETEEA